MLIELLVDCGKTAVFSLAVAAGTTIGVIAGGSMGVAIGCCVNRWLNPQEEKEVKLPTAASDPTAALSDREEALKGKLPQGKAATVK